MKKHQDNFEAPFDGIVELDNVLPPWWLALFIITILWSMVYLEGYHLFKAWDLQEEEYQTEMKLAEKQAALAAQKQDGSKAPKAGELPSDPESLAMGKEIYAKNCASCHAQAGEGLIGPNLTDRFWIHGGSDEAIIKVIQDGVLEKGMLPWKQTLKPREILAVSGFIRSLQDTNPPNAKEAQGEEYNP